MLEPNLTDDPVLLNAMMVSGRAAPAIYQPGPYWRPKSEHAFRELLRRGISDFRGHSGMAVSFADGKLVDYLETLDVGAFRKALAWLFRHIPPFNTVLGHQRALTRTYLTEALTLRSSALANDTRTKRLLSAYSMPFSTLGGCVDYFSFDSKIISSHYLSLIAQIAHVGERIELSRPRSLLEIGGGFGANLHLMIENFPNVRKVVYIDVAPQLYIATQYLRAFYGNAVTDFRSHAGCRINFKENSDLEIIMLTPCQIIDVEESIDLFWNQHSFVEMPPEVIANYAKIIMKLPNTERTTIVLLSYGGWDPSTTINPAKLPSFFPGRSFETTNFHPVGTEFDAAVLISDPSREVH